MEAKAQEKKEVSYRTASGLPLKGLYGPEDLAGMEYAESLGNPGEYPFTRGVYREMYRKRPWTVRQYAGFGTGEDTHERFKFLLAHGQTGLSLALDLPTQLGLDSDDHRAKAEVGKVGVAIDSLADMELIFRDIPLDRISTSFTINATASIILAMYIAVAEKQGVRQDQLRGTVQNDIIKEYLARGTYIFPPKPSITLVGDIIEYCLQHIPKFNAVSISAHMRQAGSSAIQTWALQFLNACVYMEEVMRRGYSVDQVAPMFSFLQASCTDFFESIARVRAARRLWARMLKEKYGAQDPEGMRLKIAMAVDCRFLTAAQPLNNIARIAYGALANVLAGCQSMLLPSYDEAYTIPSEEAVRVSLMIQQILIHEQNVRAVADPLGGSYFIEALTNDCEKEILRIMDDINHRGGIVKNVEQGVIQKEMARQAYEQELELQRGERVLVGVNKFQVGEDRSQYEVKMHVVDPKTYDHQVLRLQEVRASRDGQAVEAALRQLVDTAKEGKNLMPPLIGAVKAYATVGEIVAALEKVFGRYRQPVSL